MEAKKDRISNNSKKIRLDTIEPNEVLLPTEESLENGNELSDPIVMDHGSSDIIKQPDTHSPIKLHLDYAGTIKDVYENQSLLSNKLTDIEKADLDPVKLLTMGAENERKIRGVLKKKTNSIKPGAVKEITACLDALSLIVSHLSLACTLKMGELEGLKNQIKCVSENDSLNAESLIRLEENLSDVIKTNNKIYRNTKKILGNENAISKNEISNSPNESIDGLIGNNDSNNTNNYASCKIPLINDFRMSNAISITPDPNGKFKDVEEFKSQIKLALRPKSKCLQIDKIFNTKQTGLVVIAGRDSDKKALLKDPDISKLGKVSETIKLRNPRVIIKGVPRKVEDAEFTIVELIECILAQNEEIELGHPEECKLAFYTGRRSEPRVNMVLEVSPRLRNMLVSRGHLYLNLDICKVEDFKDVTRCFRCQRFGHVQSKCKHEERCCHCGAHGHKVGNCPSLDQPPKCANCQLKHRSSFFRCPSRSEAIKWFMNLTDYGRQR